MFCLRSWIPVLFFLQNASPVYLVLFLSATYFLNRPCVYCSLLLAILICVLFDFRQPWFEDRNALIEVATTSYAANGTISAIAETAAVALSALNENVAALAGFDLERKDHERIGWVTVGAEWVKNTVARRELRIDCMNTVIRL